MVELWTSYTPEQLETIVDFMHRGNQIMAEENAALRGRPRPSPEAGPTH
jgi:hypothetical protein